MKAHSGIRRQKTYFLLEKEEGPSHGSKTHEDGCNSWNFSCTVTSPRIWKALWLDEFIWQSVFFFLLENADSWGSCCLAEYTDPQIPIQTSGLVILNICLMGQENSRKTTTILPLTWASRLVPWSPEAVARIEFYYYYYYGFQSCSYPIGIFKIKHFERFIWWSHMGLKPWSQRSFRAHCCLLWMLLPLTVSLQHAACWLLASWGAGWEGITYTSGSGPHLHALNSGLQGGRQIKLKESCRWDKYQGRKDSLAWLKA